MSNEVKSITDKYQRMIDNIQWHLKTNKPTDKMELQKCYQQINDYMEMIVDINSAGALIKILQDEKSTLLNQYNELYKKHNAIPQSENSYYTEP